MNSYCERVIRMLRREYTDHLVLLGEAHLERLLWKYVEYYNTSRTHMALGKNAPEPKAGKVAPAEELVGTPVLGGLHHIKSARPERSRSGATRRRYSVLCSP